MTKIAAVVPPAKILLDEMDARGIDRDDLPHMFKMTPETFNKFVRGEIVLTVSIAMHISRWTNTDPIFWVNLEQQWQQAKK